MKDYRDQLKKIGKRIRIARKAMGKSQRFIGANLAMDEKYLRQIEKGQANPTLKVLLKITRELEISLSELFDDIH